MNWKDGSVSCVAAGSNVSISLVFTHTFRQMSGEIGIASFHSRHIILYYNLLTELISENTLYLEQHIFDPSLSLPSIQRT